MFAVEATVAAAQSEPSRTDEVRSLLGLINYVQWSITKYNSTFKWVDECQVL